MRRLWHSIGLVPLFAGAPACAQLVPAVPHLPAPLSPDRILGRVDDALESTTEPVARQLEATRRSTAPGLVRAHPDRIALDPDGNPARAGEVVIDDPDAALSAMLQAKGYDVLAREEVLGVRYARLAVPHGRSLGHAVRELRKLGASGVAADPGHQPLTTFSLHRAVSFLAGPDTSYIAGTTLDIDSGATA